MLGVGLGHEMPAVLAVVGSFMGGMALGSAILDRHIRRSRNPALWYGGLEIVIGLWGLASLFFIPWLNEAARHLIGLSPSPWRQWLASLIPPGLLLLPATAAMGATFPAMERFLSTLTAQHRCVGGVYAANTMGAVTGVMATTFLMAPALGYRASVGSLAMVNLLCGLGALLWAGKVRTENLRTETAPSARGVARVGWRVAVFVTGFLGIGYEVLGVRVLAQVLENTVYSYASVLAVYLLGTTAGAAWYQRWGRHMERVKLETGVMAGLSLSCALGMRLIAAAPAFHAWLRAAWGGGSWGGISAEMGVAVLIFGLPTLCMGALFSHLLQEMQQQVGSVGRGFALNTLGGGLAGAVFGVALLPWLGARWAMGLVALSYLPLIPRGPNWRWILWVSTIALVVLWPPWQLRIVEVPKGGKVIEYREGVMATVAVVEDAAGDRVLKVDNRFQMGGTAAAKAEYRHAHVPLLMHPEPRQALFLGLGTGITMGAALVHPGLHSDGVELVPEVLEVIPAFKSFNGSLATRSNVTLHSADARRFVRGKGLRYDVIVADLFHPARDGAGALYTLEHFQAVRSRLAPGGLFCQWLPLHQMDEDMLRTVVATFLAVFPEAQAWLLRLSVEAPVLGLVGFDQPKRFEPGWVERRLNDAGLKEALITLGLADSLRFLGGLLADAAALKAFAGNAPLNTDNHPRVIYGAPAFVYQRRTTSYDRLLALVEAVSPGREAMVAALVAGDAAWRGGLLDYMTSRDVYLRGLVADTEGKKAEAIEAYLESARLSGDFTAGYAQCLTIASILAREDPAPARALLRRLMAAQPSRTVAAEMLRRLEENP